MDFTTLLFLITLSSRTVFSAPAKDEAISSADTKLNENEKMLEKNADVKLERADDKEDLKTSDSNLSAVDTMTLDQKDLLKEGSSKLAVKLENKDTIDTSADTSANKDDLKNVKTNGVKTLDIKEKVVNSEDISIINKDHVKKIENKEVKQSQIKGKIVSNDDTPSIDMVDLKKSNIAEVKKVEDKDMNVNSEDATASENNSLKSSEHVKETVLDDKSVPSFDLKIEDIDPNLVKAVPELRTLSEVNSELKNSIKKLTEMAKKHKPLVQKMDDKGKAEVSVSASTTSSDSKISFIQKVANAAGHFVASLINLPVIFLSSLQQVMYDIGLSKPSSGQVQTGFSATIGSDTSPPSHR